VIALIAAAQLVLPVVLYGLSPELYRVISGAQESGSGGLGLSLLQQVVTGCLIWFAAGLGKGARRAVLALPPLKGRVFTYVNLAVVVYSIMVPVKFISFILFSFLDSQSPPIGVAIELNSNLLWLTALVLVIAAPLTEEFMYRGFLLSALAKSKLGFWGGVIITDATWTAMHAFYEPRSALPAIFVLGLLVSFLLWRTGSYGPAFSPI
jgi:membrane protease YdiL (CAAX protease family)